MHPSLHGKVCVGTGATVPYGMHFTHPSWYGILCLGTAFVHPSWYGTLCLATGATVPYRMHLCILAGMVHCVLIQVLLRDIG